MDAEAYFSVLSEVLLKAEHQILLIGWEFDTRTVLRRDVVEKRDYRFSTLVRKAVRANRSLTISILAWKYSKIYIFDRELFQRIHLAWPNIRRLRFRYDDNHPIAASHHEKIVVVDDRLAFCGGLDLSKGRWDTTAHTVNDPRRITPAGEKYEPFHDVQAMVNGEVAAALGLLCRERWGRATGIPLSPPANTKSLPLAGTFEFSDVEIGISRTQAAYKGQPEVREIETLIVALVRAAQMRIYIENQFLTARTVTNAISERLREKGGPEIVVILPQHHAAGFIEKNAISKQQEEVLWRLKSADEHGRLHVFFPTDPDLRAGQQITVHAKLMVVDDRWLSVGSANFNNRSMGLDTECNLVLDAHADSTNRARISAYVSKSVAHFLKIDPASLPDIAPARCSLSEEIAKRLPSPYLRRMPMENVGGWLSSQDIEEMPIVDPQRPFEIEQAVDKVLFQKDRKRLLANVPLGLILTLGFCFGVAALWVAFPLSEVLGSEQIAPLLEARKSSGLIVILSVAIFVIGTLILIPLNLLIVVAAVVIPGPQAFWVILLSAMVAAVVGYGEGRVLGVQLLKRLTPKRFEDLKYRMSGNSTLTIALFRLVPLAQFGLVNCIAGALRLSFLNYFAGTLIGLLPGVVSLFALQKSVLQLLQRPDLQSLLWFSAALLGVGLLIFVVYRRMRRYDD